MSVIVDSLEDPKVATLLLDNAVGVLPSDTVYGLMCAANNKDAVTKLYKVKGRSNKPGTVIASTIDQLVELGIKKRYLNAVEQFWPNPVSVVIPSYDLEYIHLGVGSVAVRVVSDERLRSLLNKTGPLLTTSANYPGEPEATTIEASKQCFGDNVDLYVDGGDLSNRQASTVIRVIDDAIEVLRQGAVKINEAGRIIK